MYPRLVQLSGLYAHGRWSRAVFMPILCKTFAQVFCCGFFPTAHAQNTSSYYARPWWIMRTAGLPSMPLVCQAGSPVCRHADGIWRQKSSHPIHPGYATLAFRWQPLRSGYVMPRIVTQVCSQVIDPPVITHARSGHVALSPWITSVFYWWELLSRPLLAFCLFSGIKLGGVGVRGNQTYTRQQQRRNQQLASVSHERSSVGEWTLGEKKATGIQVNEFCVLRLKKEIQLLRFSRILHYCLQKHTFSF